MWWKRNPWHNSLSCLSCSIQSQHFCGIMWLVIRGTISHLEIQWFVTKASTGKSLSHRRSLIKIVTVIMESVNHHEKWEIADSWMGRVNILTKITADKATLNSWAWRTDESLYIRITSCRLKKKKSFLIAFSIYWWAAHPPLGRDKWNVISLLINSYLVHWFSTAVSFISLQILT